MRIVTRRAAKSVPPVLARTLVTGAEGFIGNVRACAGDAEALQAFTQAVHQQARKR